MRTQNWGHTAESDLAAALGVTCPFAECYDLTEHSQLLASDGPHLLVHSSSAPDGEGTGREVEGLGLPRPHAGRVILNIRPLPKK